MIFRFCLLMEGKSRTDLVSACREVKSVCLETQSRVSVGQGKAIANDIHKNPKEEKSLHSKDTITLYDD